MAITHPSQLEWCKVVHDCLSDITHYEVSFGERTQRLSLPADTDQQQTMRLIFRIWNNLAIADRVAEALSE